MSTNRIIQNVWLFGLVISPLAINAQLYTPGGSLASHGGAAGVGIGQSLPAAQLDINYRGSSNSGLLHLFARKHEAGIFGGTQIFVPDYAFRLDYQLRDEAVTKVFEIGCNGELEVGSLNGVSSTTFSSFQNDLGIYLPGQSLKFQADATVEWEGENSLRIRPALAGTDLLELSSEGSLHLRNIASSFSYGEGAVYGLRIENNASAGHNYALEIATGHGKIFDISNSGHMHLGPDLNFDIPDSDDYRLYVQDGIRTERVRVDIAANNGWADHVFEPGYPVPSPAQWESYISQHGHLPGVPGQEEVCREGIDLAEMDRILLEKIEELSLMIIDLDKRLAALPEVKEDK